METEDPIRPNVDAANCPRCGEITFRIPRLFKHKLLVGSKRYCCDRCNVIYLRWMGMTFVSRSARRPRRPPVMWAPTLPPRMPSAKAGAKPDATPQPFSDPVPDAIPEAWPQARSESIPEAIPQAIPEAFPEVIAEAVHSPAPFAPPFASPDKATISATSAAPTAKATITPTIAPIAPQSNPSPKPPRQPFKWPVIKLPSIKLPAIKVPTIKLPTIKWPGIRLPSIKWPALHWPKSSIRWSDFGRLKIQVNWAGMIKFKSPALTDDARAKARALGGYAAIAIGILAVIAGLYLLWFVLFPYLLSGDRSIRF